MKTGKKDPGETSGKEAMPERFVQDTPVVLIEEGDPDKCELRDEFGNPIDKDGNLLPG